MKLLNMPVPRHVWIVMMILARTLERISMEINPIPELRPPEGAVNAVMELWPGMLMKGMDLSPE